MKTALKLAAQLGVILFGLAWAPLPGAPPEGGAASGAFMRVEEDAFGLNNVAEIDELEKALESLVAEVVLPKVELKLAVAVADVAVEVVVWLLPQPAA